MEPLGERVFGQRASWPVAFREQPGAGDVEQAGARCFAGAASAPARASSGAGSTIGLLPRMSSQSRNAAAAVTRFRMFFTCWAEAGLLAEPAAQPAQVVPDGVSVQGTPVLWVLRSAMPPQSDLNPARLNR